MSFSIDFRQDIYILKRFVLVVATYSSGEPIAKYVYYSLC